MESEFQQMFTFMDEMDKPVLIANMILGELGNKG